MFWELLGASCVVLQWWKFVCFVARWVLTRNVDGLWRFHQMENGRGTTTRVGEPKQLLATSVDAPCVPNDDLETVSDVANPDTPDGVSP